MAKQLSCQRYIYKINSSRLRKAGWDLRLTLTDARKNEELVSIASSQVLRWIDELNGIEDGDLAAREIKREIRRVRKEPPSAATKKRIKELYSTLDTMQFKPDYMLLIMDKVKDYRRASKGFFINGIKYRRFLGTAGGIKNSTIVFVSERLHDELMQRVTNGRDLTKELVPAKLEAYQALTCSASIPVSMPRGVIVVKDCETVFRAEAVNLAPADSGEPEMKYTADEEVTLTESDGYGLMMPSLARRWGEELGIDYLPGGVNTRFAWEKGMVFCFDFQEFAREIAGTNVVVDAWGVERNIMDTELILTTSQLKLWDSYPSCEAYLECCRENGYNFGITKVSPLCLENMRSLNYQFIQSYDLNDEDIEDLCSQTIGEIRNVLSGDYRKTLVYLRGNDLNERVVRRSTDDFIKALMIEPKMLHDPYVQDRIYSLIAKRIKEAKVGVLNVHGNYSIVSGDPYALCQSIFGMPITGLLKKGEIYNQYWSDLGVENLVCFRAPMSCFNNIRAVKTASSPEVQYWFRHMQSCTAFNAWDTAAQSLNGMDKDGDLVFLTDNNVLVKRHYVTPALMCAQTKAPKKVPTEDDIIESNIKSFGDAIGSITNKVTSMFEVQSRFEKESREYQVLDYRIKCGQLFQQDAIDKAKGIVAKPMPKEWYDRHAIQKMADRKEQRFYLRIIADRKPYFFCYIYPDLMDEFKDFTKKADKKAKRRFGMSILDMQKLPKWSLSTEQREFVRRYENSSPVGVGPCIVNRICWRIEKEFNGYVGRHNASEKFDYTIMKSGVQYSRRKYEEIFALYNEYKSRLHDYLLLVETDQIEENQSSEIQQIMKEEFRERCDIVCPCAAELCDILLDICYRRNNTKKFCWDMCSKEIIQNLLKRNGGVLQYPEKNTEGEFEYSGERFTIKQLRMEVVDDEYNFE